MDMFYCTKNLMNLNGYLSQFHRNNHSALFEKISSESLGHILDLPVYNRDNIGILPTNYFIKWFGKDSPLEKSPNRNSDIIGRCYNFDFTAEATMKTGENQCAQEFGSSITHFRQFITDNQIDPKNGCILFITPKLHESTYVMLKNSRRDPQTKSYQIIPIEISTLISILQTKMIAFTMMQADFRIISNKIHEELYKSPSLENFRIRVVNKLDEWKNDVILCEKNACLGLLIYDLMRNKKPALDITELEVLVKHKRKIQQFSKFLESEITDLEILEALLTNGFARTIGRSFGNVERIEFVPIGDSNHRLERYKHKLESLA